MANYRSTEIALARRYVDWGAIWGGVFCYMAICIVFEALGVAVFASAASWRSSFLHLGAGLGIWSIVLSIIAMFVAGRLTGRMCGAVTREEGVAHGLILFGLCVVCVAVLVALGGTALSASVAGAIAATSDTAMGATRGAMAAAPTLNKPYVFSLLSGLGWAGFAALFLSWLAALLGAGSGVAPRVVEQREVREIRPAA